MKLTLATELTMLYAEAFFSCVCPQVLPTQPRIMLFTAYVPIVKTNIAKYRTPVLSVAQPVTNPAIAIILATVICHVLSLNRPDDIDQKMDVRPAMRYGGHVSTNVMVVLKPRVLHTSSQLPPRRNLVMPVLTRQPWEKKFLNPLAARCMCCIKAKTQTR